MLLRRAALLLSTRTLHYTARLIRSHRRTIGSRWWALEPGWQPCSVANACTRSLTPLLGQSVRPVNATVR